VYQRFIHDEWTWGVVTIWIVYFFQYKGLSWATYQPRYTGIHMLKVMTQTAHDQGTIEDCRTCNREQTLTDLPDHQYGISFTYPLTCLKSFLVEYLRRHILHFLVCYSIEYLCYAKANSRDPSSNNTTKYFTNPGPGIYIATITTSPNGSPAG
jgi:hypothetical protein